MDFKEHTQEEVSKPSFWRNTKVRRILASAGTLLLAGGIFLASHQYVEANKVPFYRVYLNGQEIGAVKNSDQLEDVYEERQAELAEQYPSANIVLETDGITTTLDKSYKAKVDVKETQQKLGEVIPYHAEGVAIKIDGKVVAVVKDKASANEVLNEIKGKYAPSLVPTAAAAKVKKLSISSGSSRTESAQAKSANTSNTPKIESAAFVEKVEQSSFSGKADEMASVDEVVTKLLTNEEEPVTYVVKEGDTLSSIASAFGTTSAAITQMNPGLSELKLQIGTELNLKQAEAPLTVKTVEKVSEQVTTEPTVVYRTNNKLAAGKTLVASPGAHGTKVMSYKIVKENGHAVSRQYVGQTVTKATSPKIIVKGTLQIKKQTTRTTASTTAKKKSSSSSKLFAWPISSPTITSSYGTRWGDLHKGMDMVSSNRNIKAAASGTVTFAGTKTGYGNCIVIKHANGYETLYGHLSKISVKKGQSVSQGDKIGVMGSTGHSTGTHLHFEIHKNGSLQNPSSYLK